MTQTTTTPRPARAARRNYRPPVRPLVSTEALIVGYLLALATVGGLGVWLAFWIRSL